MTADIHFDRHQRSEKNVQTLRNWVDHVALDSVPVNQYGGASRQAICRHLRIARSSCQTNPRIKEIFNELDSALTRERASSQVGRPQKSNGTEPDAASAEVIKTLQKQNETLSRRIALLEYLEETGWELRQ